MRLQGRVHTQNSLTEIEKKKATDFKRRKNFNSSEVEELLQEVNSKQAVIFSNVSSGYKITALQINCITQVTRSPVPVVACWLFFVGS